MCSLLMCDVHSTDVWRAIYLCLVYNVMVSNVQSTDVWYAIYWCVMCKLLMCDVQCNDERCVIYLCAVYWRMMCKILMCGVQWVMCNLRMFDVQLTCDLHHRYICCATDLRVLWNLPRCVLCRFKLLLTGGDGWQGWLENESHVRVGGGCWLRST